MKKHNRAHKNSTISREMTKLSAENDKDCGIFSRMHIELATMQKDANDQVKQIDFAHL